jgi:hypothetical protein
VWLPVVASVGFEGEGAFSIWKGSSNSGDLKTERPVH